jgi:hypothetical protein
MNTSACDSAQPMRDCLITANWKAPDRARFIPLQPACAYSKRVKHDGPAAGPAIGAGDRELGAGSNCA